jgi:hypothetical protein
MAAIGVGGGEYIREFADFLGICLADMVFS